MEPTLIQILLIEDNPIESHLIRGLLADQTEARFSLECADRLSTGLERLAAGGIELVLSDLALTAVQEGAEDFLIKGQVDGQSLSRSLRFAIERHRRFQAEDMLHTANNEFRAARAIQQKLFPTVPELSSFDIGGMSYCAVGTCGDYFDYIRMPDDGVGIVVADVSGHGLGPALLMASCRAYLRALARADGDIGDIVVLFSDGVLEARAPDGTMFGADRALDVIRVYLDETALQIVDNLYYAVRLFSQAAPQEDDITAVIVKVGTATSA